MPPVPIFRGVVEGGKIHLDNPEPFRALLETLEGKRISVRVTRYFPGRSLSQNRFLWGVVYPMLGDHLGYDKEELHDAMKHRFLRDREHEKDGLVRVRSTSKLTTVEFNEYIERVRRFAAEYGVVIPDPGELG